MTNKTKKIGEKAKQKTKPLKIGDVVELKSGSSAMTLYLITDNGNYWCRYYQGGEWLEQAFTECELKRKI